MRKAVIAAATLCSIVATAALAHPPSSLTVAVTGSTVSVSVPHRVGNPSNHYISTIEVFVNGAKLVTQGFTLQETADAQVALYYLPGLKTGDTVTVRADCNKGGDLKRDVVVSADRQSPADRNPRKK